MLERGGNAADAALAAAAVLGVVEPMSTGIGGDMFAIVWRDGEAEFLDAAGPAPAAADANGPVAELGPASVTVPGAAGGWGALAERYARFGLDECLADAVDLAERGVALGTRTAEAWNRDTACPSEFGLPAPTAGERIRIPGLSESLRAVAEEGPDVMYRGRLAEAIASVSWLEETDLAGFSPSWKTPLRHTYRGVEILESPPPTQGVTALEALALLEGLDPDLPNLISSVALAVEDGLAQVRDGADVAPLLDAERLVRRRGERPRGSAGPDGGTAYVGVVDSDGMAVSLIESLYASFGSGVAVPETGIVLQNRGACFAVAGAVSPGKRPYHTIMPGLVLRHNELAAVLGVVGGFMQPQAHVQLISALVDDRMDPQAALDRSRFRVERDFIRLEPGLAEAADELRRLGWQVRNEPEGGLFGKASLIVAEEVSLLGAADPRGDGSAAGL
jgi:gamma-glutamyltranspeptidase/glutathione hydrolase